MVKLIIAEFGTPLFTKYNTLSPLFIFYTFKMNQELAITFHDPPILPLKMSFPPGKVPGIPKPLIFFGGAGCVIFLIPIHLGEERYLVASFVSPLYINSLIRYTLPSSFSSVPIASYESIPYT